jgi:CelD/BcsL family acetyltransferase involved in cellulose biosynthesis
MIVESVDKLEDFQSLRMAWNAVYRSDPEAQFFLSWSWLAGALETYPGEWIVLVARGADGSYLGFLPLSRETVWSKSNRRLCNKIHFAGRLFWADYGGIPCYPEHDEAVLLALALHLKQMNWSHISLKNFRISERRLGIFMEPLVDDRLSVKALTSLINRGETDNLICPFVDLPETFESYLAEKLSSNARQKTRRMLRRLESSSEFKITTTSAPTRSRDVQILEKLWYNLWKSRKGSDTQHFASKYGMIVKRGLDNEMVHMPVLWHGDTPVGALASFIDRDKSRLLFFVGGRDRDFRNLPVGLVLHTHNVRWAIENGIRTYDLLRGNEPYKYSLGARQHVQLTSRLIRTKSGRNLNGKLDPGCIGEALRIAEDLAKRELTLEAMAACQQILATVPEQEAAKRLLKGLADAQGARIETGAQLASVDQREP